MKTGETCEYPEIQPLVFSLSPDTVFGFAVRAVDSLPRWCRMKTDHKQRKIQAEARTRLFRFIDDVSIQVQGKDNGSVVHVESASRIGKGDLGQNARNIRLFFRTLKQIIESEIDLGV